MKKFYFCLLYLLFTVSLVKATHIVGGEFALVAKGRAYQYELSMNFYFDDINGDKGAEDKEILAAIYSKRTNRLITVIRLPILSYKLVDYTNPACTSSNLKTRQIRYAADIALDPNIYNDEAGYYVVWERCCRNNSINNISNPEDAGMAFYMEFPAIVQNNRQFVNSSPVFSLPKGDYACVNEPFIFDFSATDADGDQLMYKLVTPYKGYSSSLPTTNRNPYINGDYKPAPYPPVVWLPGIDLTNVIPGKAPLRVNATTGELSFTANKTGLYVFSVLCEEFRNGQKIGEVRRDYQLMVIDCPKNIAPQVKLKEPNTSTFYQEGQVIKIPYTDSRCFNVAIVDSNLREQINLVLKPINFQADLATLTPTRGSLNGPSDTLWAELCWDKCAQSKPGEPFEFAIIALDNSCPLPKPDTLLVKMDLEPKPNNPPMIVTSLPGNTATIIAGTSLTFDVTGTDLPDNEEITLEAIGRGFDLNKVGMSFQSGSAVGTITTPFIWQPSCDQVEENAVYLVDFIVRDKRCPEQQKADTVTVELYFKARVTQKPDIKTTLEDNLAKLLTDQEIRFDVIATDPDKDPIVLRAVGRGFDLTAAGMQFNNNQAGVGEIIEPFYWKPTCENILSEQSTYIIDFIVEDNSCATNRYDTVTVTLEISDVEVVFEGFLPPNVFTPNGDQVNDTFYIDNLPGDNCREWFENIEIYNRWGKLVYRDDSRDFSWSGTGFSTGIYFYLLHYHKTTYKGTVTLLR